MTDLTEEHRNWAWSFDEEYFRGGYASRDEAEECGIVEGADPYPGEGVIVYTGWIDTDAEPFTRAGEKLYPVRDVEAHEYTFKEVLRACGELEHVEVQDG
jgi:hypothetical protein